MVNKGAEHSCEVKIGRLVLNFRRSYHLIQIVDEALVDEGQWWMSEID